MNIIMKQNLKIILLGVSVSLIKDIHLIVMRSVENVEMVVLNVLLIPPIQVFPNLIVQNVIQKKDIRKKQVGHGIQVYILQT